jgi:hypothetical protein
MVGRDTGGNLHYAKCNSNNQIRALNGFSQNKRHYLGIMKSCSHIQKHYQLVAFGTTDMGYKGTRCSVPDDG